LQRSQHIYTHTKNIYTCMIKANNEEYNIVGIYCSACDVVD